MGARVGDTGNMVRLSVDNFVARNAGFVKGGEFGSVDSHIGVEFKAE